jgi:hypothetical protein
MSFAILQLEIRTAFQSAVTAIGAGRRRSLETPWNQKWLIRRTYGRALTTLHGMKSKRLLSIAPIAAILRDKVRVALEVPTT